MNNIEKKALEEKEELEEGIKNSLDELKNEKVEITYNGKVFEFPKVMPAWVSLFYKMHGKGKDMALPEDKMLDFLAKVIGSELVQEIVENADNNFSINDLNESIIQPIERAWVGQNKPKKK